MGNQKGVTLFEMILSLLLFSILSAAMLEGAVKPLQTYSLYTSTIKSLENMHACVNIIARDISALTKDNIHVDNSGLTTILIPHTQVSYIFSNQEKSIRRISSLGNEYLLKNIHTKIDFFSNAQSQGVVITLSSTQDPAIKLTVPILLKGGA